MQLLAVLIGLGMLFISYTEGYVQPFIGVGLRLELGSCSVLGLQVIKRKYGKAIGIRDGFSPSLHCSPGDEFQASSSEFKDDGVKTSKQEVTPGRKATTRGSVTIKPEEQDFTFDLTRFVTYNILALLLALGANFLGITTAAMSTNPSFFRSLGVDQLYSINGYRREKSVENQYEFIFPDKWVVDQTILMNKLRQKELPTAMRIQNSPSTLIKPDIAYGPIGGSGRENLSVIKSNVMPGFQLNMLGTPQEAAERLLSTVIAPKASGKEYSLVTAYKDTRNGLLAYIFEYNIRRATPTATEPTPASASTTAAATTTTTTTTATTTTDTTTDTTIKTPRPFNQHSISVVLARGTDLYTFTATVPEEQWNDKSAIREQLMECAKSFQLSDKGADPSLPAGFY